MKIRLHRSVITCVLLAISAFVFYPHLSATAELLARSEKGWLGVRIVEMTPSMRDEYAAGDRTGLLVVDVVRNSPADEAGVQEDDIIVSLNGKRYDRVGAFTNAVAALAPGSEVEVKVLRAGEEQPLDVTIARMKRRRHSWGVGWGPPDVTFAFGGPKLGVRVHELNADLAEYFDTQEHAGVLIVEVVAGGPADSAGLKAGDIITKIDDSWVSQPDDLMARIREMDGGEQVAIEFIRKGKTASLDVQLAGPDFQFGELESPEGGIFHFGRGRHQWPGMRLEYFKNKMAKSI